jgi:hypothetical protein
MRHQHNLSVTALTLAFTISAVATWAAQDAAAAPPSARGRTPARSNSTPNLRRPAPPVPAGLVQIGDPDQLPSSLPGTWKISLCIAGEQSWLRLEDLKTGEFHTLSRGGQNPQGVQWDLDVARESEITSTSHIRASTTVQNPRVFRGTQKDRGYGPSTGNCAGFSRDAWYFYSGEWYPLPSPPSAAALRELVLRKHPEQPLPVFIPKEEARRPQPRPQAPRRGR